MNRRRNGKSTKPQGYQKQLLHAMGKHLPHKGLALQSDDDRLRWTDRMLVMGGVLFSWSPSSTLLDAFECSRDTLVAMYKTRRRPGTTAKGFFKALAKRSPELLVTLKSRLQHQVIRVAGSRWRWKRWVMMAVDGSRVECPRTAANEEAFECGGRDKTTPQQWVTTVFHVASGLLWDYRKGKATDSERSHLRQMLAGLPARGMLLMDAGFTGFDLLQSITNSNRHFIVRVGANVTLLKGLGYEVQEKGSTVWLWPEGHQGTQAPLTLRKVEFTSHGRKVCLLTNVLSKEVLSDREIKEWYRRRWMIEVQYRGLKQTMENRKLQSDSPQMARTELDWAILGLWLLELMQVGTRRWRRTPRYSLAQALRVVRRAMHRIGRVPAGGLERQLRQAMLDGYQRSRPKKARAWPHKKKDPPCGYPNIRMATPREIRLAQAFHDKKIPA
jgi:hypothetical protein